MFRIFITFAFVLLGISASAWASGKITLVLEQHQGCPESQEKCDRLLNAQWDQKLMVCREGIVAGSELESFYGALGIENSVQHEFLGHFIRWMETSIYNHQGVVPEVESYALLGQKWLGPLKTESAKRQWESVKSQFLATSLNPKKDSVIEEFDHVMHGGRLVLSEFDALMHNLEGVEELFKIWATLSLEETRMVFLDIDFTTAEELLKLKSFNTQQYKAFHEEYNFGWRERTWVEHILQNSKHAPKNHLAVIVGALHARSLFDKLTDRIKKDSIDLTIAFDDSIFKAPCMNGEFTKNVSADLQRQISGLPTVSSNWLD